MAAVYKKGQLGQQRRIKKGLQSTIPFARLCTPATSPSLSPLSFCVYTPPYVYTLCTCLMYPTRSPVTVDVQGVRCGKV
ncbi:hypothetical protein E2C01_002872 [Portunus trituberculatus]|uniref:Uncharacterized protein n=1 Tax=Portunus trituberculatus TaxID=210409 RepID=A0A5B7CLE9_PORTR|nr:hypothetical protein [Portunus trituberculatus]